MSISTQPLNRFRDGRFLRWTGVFFRILLGAYFLLASVGKLTDSQSSQEFMLKMFDSHMDAMVFPYRAFIVSVVIPWKAFFIGLVGLGEALLGLALLTGLFVRIATIPGTFMVLNFAFAKGLITGAAIADIVVICLLVFLAWLNAGQTFGLDKRLSMIKEPR